MQLLPGTLLDRYVVLRAIGRGATSEVYAVRDRATDALHALKLLRDGTPAQRERLVREAAIQARLDPEVVLPVSATLDVGGHPALLMPLIQGCALSKLALPLTPGLVHVVVSDVARALRSAHHSNVVHRDLKPENVLLEVRHGRVSVRVCDFGLAAATRDEGGIVGTPPYTSPEQQRGEAVDGRSDLWALGVMAHQLLTGALPSPSAPALPPAWEPVVHDLLQPRAADRIVSAAQLLERLRPLRVLGSRDALATRVQASSRSVTPVVRSSPDPRGTLVGRDAEVATVARWLASDLLISLVGPGGAGKTRLARELIERAEARGEPSVFCDLTEVTTAEATALRVAHDLGCPLGELPVTEAVSRHLAGLPGLLLVLDNVEQLLPGLLPLLQSWMHAAPTCRVLTTSRIRLDLEGERVLPCDPLPTADALQLFRDRCQVVCPALDWAHEAAAAHQLVELLDRLPLALELAAAQVDRSPPSALLPLLAERFRLLVDPRRDPRQATLRACIDWSWEHLEPALARVLEPLSVFVGPFTPEDARAVVPSANERALGALADASLLQVEPDGRFRLLVSVRAFAQRQLSTAAHHQATLAHARWYARFSTLEVAVPAVGDAPTVAHRQGLNEMLAALERPQVHGEPELVGQLTVAAVLVLRRIGPFETLTNLCERALALPVSGEIQVLLYLAAGEAARVTGRVHRALELAEQAVAHAEQGSPLLHAVALDQHSRTLRRAGGDRGRALEQLTRARALHEAVGSSAGAASVAAEHALALLAIPDFPAAEALAHEALALDPPRTGRRTALRVLGVCLHNRGELEEGLAHLFASIASAQADADHQAEMFGRYDVAEALGVAGDVASAYAHALTARSLCSTLSLSHEGSVEGLLGLLAAFDERTDEARRHLQAACRRFEATGDAQLGRWQVNLATFHLDHGEHREALATVDRLLTTCVAARYRVEAGVIATEAALDLHDPALARRYLEPALELGKHTSYAPQLQAELARIEVDEGALDAAWARLEAIHTSVVWMLCEIELTRARVSLLKGRRDDARVHLEEAQRRYSPLLGHRVRRAIEALARDLDA